MRDNSTVLLIGRAQSSINFLSNLGLAGNHGGRVSDGEDKSPAADDADLKRAWSTVVGGLSTAAAPLTVLAVFRTFGPFTNLNTWLHNVFTAYDGIIEPVRSALASIGIRMEKIELDLCLIGILFMSTSFRAMALSEGHWAFVLDVLEGVWGVVRPYAAYLVVGTIAVGIAVAQSQMQYAGLDGHQAFHFVIQNGLGLVVAGAPLLVGGYWFGLFLLVAVGGKYVVEFEDASELKFYRRFRFHFITQTAIVASTAFLIFVLGTQVFFNFG